MAVAILTLALLATLIATVIGLIRPSIFSRMVGKPPARWQVLLFGFALMLAILMMVGLTEPAPKPTRGKSEAPPQPEPVPAPPPPPPAPAAPSAPTATAPTTTAPTPEKTASEKCVVDDLSCLGNAGVISASVRCQREVERLAKHSVKWTDSWIGLKFSRFRWTNKPGGNITFIGDKVEFQNGFGAFTPMIYECDMPPDAQRVIAVRAQAGRLPVNR